MTEDNLVTVFVSYSHDSPDHKRWVSTLSTALMTAGINVILDQWDTELGDDLTLFMERGVTDSNRVLIICTDEYVRKADAGKGGVGYERMIVTSELVTNIGTNKFIPVIRAGEHQPTPKFLATKKYIDFRNDAEFNDKLEELVSSLRKGPPAVKPVLGKPTAITTPTKPIELPRATTNPVETYNTAIILARADDVLGWRKYIQQLKAAFKPGLLAWRSKYDANQPTDYVTMHTAVDEAVEYIAPPMMMAFAGIESEKEKFKDQRGLFDEFYHINDWSGAGLVILIELPTALGFVYQALHGSVCMHTGQPELAISFANMRVGLRSEKKIPLWRHHGLIGWPESLGRSCTDVWRYISNGYSRWPWLDNVFGSADEYKISLISYYMVLNFIEFAQTIKEHPQIFESNELPQLDIPLNFAVEEHQLLEKALSRISTNPTSFEAILLECGITKKQAIAMWPKWIKICIGWIGKAHSWSYSDLPQANLLEHLGWSSSNIDKSESILELVHK